MNHGSQGCKDHNLCGKVHPKLCREAMNFKICGQHWCSLRHPRWDQFEPGTEIPPLGAHNGGQWNKPPPDYPYAPGYDPEKGPKGKKGDRPGGRGEVHLTREDQ